MTAAALEDRDSHAAALMAVVEASPRLVAIHDREAWLDLFAADGVVEDPVGTAPYRKDDGRLGQFYDTFIEPHEIDFEVLRDFVVTDPELLAPLGPGRVGEVVRDVRIITTLPSGLEVTVSAHLRYELTAGISIQRMSAMWELASMSLETLKHGGRRGVVDMSAMSWRMLRIQGIGGMLGYSKGLVSGIGKRGRDALAALEARGSEAGDLFCDGAAVNVMPGGTTAASEWLRGFGGVSFDQIIVAGWSASCAIELSDGRGLAFFDFDPATKRIQRLRIYLDSA